MYHTPAYCNYNFYTYIIFFTCYLMMVLLINTNRILSFFYYIIDNIFFFTKSHKNRIFKDLKFKYYFIKTIVEK